jgi:hypothetical protein
LRLPRRMTCSQLGPPRRGFGYPWGIYPGLRTRSLHSRSFTLGFLRAVPLARYAFHERNEITPDQECCLVGLHSSPRRISTETPGFRLPDGFAFGTSEGMRATPRNDHGSHAPPPNCAPDPPVRSPFANGYFVASSHAQMGATKSQRDAPKIAQGGVT